MIVLGGPPADQDPTSGHWELYGPIKNLPTEQWSIDGTVFWINNVLYFVYSGWPLDGRPESEKTQQLFIARLQDPLTASSSPVLISDPSNPWERSGDAGINEGPQWLADPNGSFIGIVYSCAGSWTRDYKLGVLQYEGGDPLNPHSWKKWHKPLLQSGDNAHCHGPGHCSFVPYNHEMLVIFHATDNPTDGWGNRKARAQVLNFHNGLPDMGGFVGAMCDSLHGAEAVPSGPGGPGPSGAPTKGEEPHGLKKLEGKIKDMIKEPIKEITDELHHKRKAAINPPSPARAAPMPYSMIPAPALLWVAPADPVELDPPEPDPPLVDVAPPPLELVALCTPPIDVKVSPEATLEELELPLELGAGVADAAELEPLHPAD
ncbi:MAG: hypothetical protein M1820_000443 [Bogoriella megaspora]|nr:MAG: hypothetical protein M1820_000443 [Bogoriella megaspora]